MTETSTPDKGLEEPLSILASRLQSLERGSYHVVPSPKLLSMEALKEAIGRTLDFLGISYDKGEEVEGGFTPTFSLSSGFIHIAQDKEEEGRAQLELERLGRPYLLLSASSLISRGIAKNLVEGEQERQAITIFLDDPSFNFDYSHILPTSEKCSTLHGHSSSLLVEVKGFLKDGMVIEFGELKRVVKEVLRRFDHKLLISKRYVKEGGTKGHLTVEFDGPKGHYRLEVPREEAYLLEGEATSEHLAKEVLAQLATRMPDNILEVGVYLYEGFNKGSHLLAHLHQGMGKR